MLDQTQRLEALNTQKSFIIQSPAGSGKTELLVQRYLALLSQSQAPENVIAITFTKKAAAEMRRRVLTALQEVVSEGGESSSEVQNPIRTQLAQTLYQWQKQHHWNLLSYPNRLRIQTIDSFYTSLVAQTPLLSGLGTLPKITAHPDNLYQKAVQILLAQLESSTELGTVLSDFLEQMDNDYKRVEGLLVSMLSRRDQWLPLLEDTSDFCALKTVLENTLQSIRKTRECHVETVFSTCDALAPNWRQQLHALLDFSSSQQNQNKETLDFWFSVLPLLLTTEGKWRRNVTNKQGFPSEKAAKTKEERTLYKEMKQQFTALITMLHDQDVLLAALVSLRQAPSPRYTDFQWSWLKTLFYLLKSLERILQNVFQTHTQIDHVEIGLRALKAIGSEQAPTDLMLALDYQIQHILVDEFQDTSVQQLELLKRLIEGWQPHDGRTLFLVGDPMQSIYRFRKAEASLFKRVMAHGIGTCTLDVLVLSTNFRSVSRLVHWINQHFSRMVKQSPSNVFSPAIAFKAECAHQEKSEGVHTHWLLDASEQQEAKKVIEISKAALQSSGNVAILARTRRHLFSILTQLKLAGIPFHAVEIAPLTQNPIIQDLLALTRALIHLADETAWLAILRAPWCGMSLKDLYTIRHAKGTVDLTIIPLIWENILLLQSSTQLSEEGRIRLQRVVPLLAEAIEKKGRIPLHELVKHTWLALGGPAALKKPLLLEDSLEVEFFFQHIAHMQVGEDIVDFYDFEKSLDKFYAQSRGGEAKVSVMTIHKAKGLEFDTVILPSLHATTLSDAKPLLLYDTHMDLTHNGSHLVIAPLQPNIRYLSDTSESEDPIYGYLQQKEHDQSQAEMLRLFYVACTRAKTSLHLVGVLRTKEKTEQSIIPPKAGSFLNMLWPHLETTQRCFSSLSLNALEPPLASLNETYCLERIALTSIQSSKEIKDKEGGVERNFVFKNKKEALYQETPFLWKWEAPTLEQSIGIVTHQLLHDLAQAQLSESALLEQRVELVARYQRVSRDVLLQARLTPALVEKGVAQVIQALVSTLEDPRGRWILSNHHLVARSEYALTHIEGVKDQPHAKQLVIDRTFIDHQATRWIIDYKTTRFVGKNLSDFIEGQQAQHQAQLARYAKVVQALANSKENYPIRLGLYWPRLKLWHEWAF